MEYHGKLYGKIGNKYFDTGKTSKDYDDLVLERSKFFDMLKKMYDYYSTSENIAGSLRSFMIEVQRIIKK